MLWFIVAVVVGAVGVWIHCVIKASENRVMPTVIGAIFGLFGMLLFTIAYAQFADNINVGFPKPEDFQLTKTVKLVNIVKMADFGEQFVAVVKSDDPHNKSTVYVYCPEKNGCIAREMSSGKEGGSRYLFSIIEEDRSDGIDEVSVAPAHKGISTRDFWLEPRTIFLNETLVYQFRLRVPKGSVY